MVLTCPCPCLEGLETPILGLDVLRLMIGAAGMRVTVRGPDVNAAHPPRGLVVGVTSALEVPIVWRGMQG